MRIPTILVILRSVVCPAVLSLGLAGTASAQAASIPSYHDAVRAWERGDYVQSLAGFRALLTSTAADTWHDSIAVVTGELHPAVELVADGARPAFSPDGQFALFESGTGPARVTRVHRVGAGTPLVAEMPGGNAAISASSSWIASILPPSTSRPPLVVRMLTMGSDVPVAGMEGWIASGVSAGVDDTTMFVVASRASEGDRNQILRLARTADGFVVRGPISNEPGYKWAPVEVAGGYIVHAVPAGNPVRLAGAAAGLRTATAFAIVHPVRRTSAIVRGSSVSVSADGSTIAWLARSGDSTSIMIMRIGTGEAVPVKASTRSLAAPALSPDGSQVAFQFVDVHDFEIGVVGSDGSGERRVTREIQHDVMPQWLDGATLLAVMGEARHRRSYLHDLRSGVRTRLFHNNSVRTIAPEYEWIVSPDGTKLLIVAERDGDTVSPDRGVYLVDLERKVTRTQLLARVDSNLVAERVRREQGAALYRPIAADVRKVTGEVDVNRIFAYEKALFDFDSKHVTRPGNALAIEYLERTYRSFGYQPTLQKFTAAQGIPTANVLAVLEGTENPDLVYVVSSHFDSRAEGPGADDNTSGTAALLEAARVLAKHPLPATVIFASFTAEESGLVGSREFVRQAVRDSLRLVGALNNDMLGWTNDARLDNTIRYSNPGIRDIQHAAAQQFSSMITYDALYYKNTDAAAYYEAYGDIVGGIGSYPVLGNPHYHQPHDVLETINHQLVAEASRTTVATVMLLASSPSRLRGLSLAPGGGGLTTVSWTAAPEKGIARYEVTWGTAGQPALRRRLVAGGRTSLAIPGLTPGMVVRVRAVNNRGLAGWDWARVIVPAR